MFRAYVLQDIFWPRSLRFESWTNAAHILKSVQGNLPMIAVFDVVGLPVERATQDCRMRSVYCRTDLKGINVAIACPPSHIAGKNESWTYSNCCRRNLTIGARSRRRRQVESGWVVALVYGANYGCTYLCKIIKSWFKCWNWWCWSTASLSSNNDNVQRSW